MIASPTAAGWGSGIVVRTAQRGSSDFTSRTVAPTVGSGSNDVVIAQGPGTGADGFDHSGIAIHQRSADATTVTLGSGVDIGTSATPTTPSKLRATPR